MATITKIIDSNGTPGVNCDFDSIDNWASFVAGESNPDQMGVVRGEHEYPSVALDSFTSFSIPTTQDACPRLVGDPGWQSGYALYGTSNPGNAPHLLYLTLSAAFTPGNMLHFKVAGLQIDSIDMSLSVAGACEAGVWFDAVASGYSAGINLLSSASENYLSSIKLLFTNCLFVGDGGADCLYLGESIADGGHSVAFVHSVFAKGATVSWSGWSALSVYVINSVQLCKEGTGFFTNASYLMAAGNASYPPYDSPEQLNPVYSLASPESNPGVFIDSNYYTSDYRLPAGSPLIDRGVTPNVYGWDLTGLKDVSGRSRPRGSGYDIGLYEYPSVLDPSLMLLCF